MLEDPRINFAISTGKSNETGIAHLGLQAETPEALQAIGARLQAADAVTLAEAATTCCYARSDKFWAEDPQGVRWESFHTHGDATTYYADPAACSRTRPACVASRVSIDSPKLRAQLDRSHPPDRLLRCRTSGCC